MDDRIKSAETSAPDTVSEKPFGKGVDIRSTTSGSDVEKQDVRAGQTVQLKRKLQSRHLQMIAIGMLFVIEVLKPLLMCMKVVPSVQVCSSVLDQPCTKQAQLARSLHMPLSVLSSTPSWSHWGKWRLIFLSLEPSHLINFLMRFPN